MCEFAGSLDSRVYGTNDALDLVWQAVHLCKRDGGAKGLLRTGRVGLGKQNLADGDLEDSLPLWRSLGDGPGSSTAIWVRPVRTKPRSWTSYRAVGLANGA